MKKWHVLYHHGDESCEVELVEVPLWVVVVDVPIQWVIELLGDQLSSGGPAWFNKVPLGKPHLIELPTGEKVLDRSLGDAVYTAFTHALTFADRYERPLHRFTVTAETAKLLWPEVNEIFND